VTQREVRQAQDHGATLLVVIDIIRITDTLSCSGGRWRQWIDWVPDRDALVAMAYRHPFSNEWTGDSGQ
jgi:hypothetical protein